MQVITDEMQQAKPAPKLQINFPQLSRMRVLRVDPQKSLPQLMQRLSESLTSHDIATADRVSTDICQLSHAKQAFAETI